DIGILEDRPAWVSHDEENPMSAHSHSGWITVGALADGFAPDNHVLPACGDLAGLERVLHFANGWVIEHAFDSQRLRWRLADG
ncbi:MoaF N-terminal domain-containing protein, partial [Listeria monocytogenes]|nr:MoaF N-terminal domain-containing protein [Listeria monocytogenes]